ncbi:ArsR/SmtB family transcription factor [Nocardioides sp.]|uniref:ArsR/SmtB family transcription factor n=1 Tax=Nocardioides sp. TaxID=35761 RepID=UPI003512FB3A
MSTSERMGPGAATGAVLAGEVEALDAASALLDALGDRSRLTIVQHLLLGEHRVVELTAHLGLAQSTVSKHLACLLGCGVVGVRTQGRSSYYSLTHPDAVRALLAAAGALLELTDAAVVACRAGEGEAR